VTVSLTGCRGVLVRNLNLSTRRGTSLSLRGVTGAILDLLTIRSAGDGIDLDGSRDVTLTDCHITTTRHVNGRRESGGRALRAGEVVGDALVRLPAITVRDCMLVE
jgi:hypothetical protein